MNQFVDLLLKKSSRAAVLMVAGLLFIEFHLLKFNASDGESFGDSPLSPLPVPRAREIETKRVQEERRAQIIQVCNKYGLTGKDRLDENGYGVLVKPDHKLAYCENAKTGCTTWKHHFIWLTNNTLSKKQSLAKSIHRNSDKLFNPLNELVSDTADLPEVLKRGEYFRFSFVRHPFDRLVSAYLDKIYGRRDWAYLPLALLIGRSFPKFVDYVLTKAQKHSCEMGVCRIDNHWRPFSARCAYCSMDYDVIGKIETFDQDVDFILNVKNLTRSKEEGSRFNAAPKGAKQDTLHYFSQLSENQKRGLLDLYQLDFEMFGYSSEGYM